jgi:hypothetical protein
VTSGGHSPRWDLALPLVLYVTRDVLEDNTATSVSKSARRTTGTTGHHSSAIG